MSSAVTKLQSAEGSLRLLCENNGPAVEELEGQIGQLHDVQLLNLIPQATLAVDRNKITQSLLDCMSSRFETLLSEPVYLACHAFDHKNWPLLTDRQALMQYGREDVRVIFKHASTVLTNAG